MATYLEPGAYLTKLRTPRPGAPTGLPRYPVVVAKGNRLKQALNVEFKRSFVYSETVVFSVGEPHIASLAFEADADQGTAILYKLSDGTVVSASSWYFVDSGGGVWDQVYIDPDSFDPAATYLLDYQSTQRTVLDPLPFNDISEVRLVGLNPNTKQYKEWVDFKIDTTVTAIDHPVATPPANDGYHALGPIKKTGPGGSDPVNIIAFGAGATYTCDYTREYTLILDKPAITLGDVVGNGAGAPYAHGPVILHVGMTLPITPGSITIHWPLVAVDQLITDDGLGSLVGAVNPGGVVNYVTGVATFTTNGNVDVGVGNITVDYVGGNWIPKWRADLLAHGECPGPNPYHSTEYNVGASFDPNAPPAALALEYGITVDLSTCDIADMEDLATFKFIGFGPPWLETDARLGSNTNEFAIISSITFAGTGTGTAVVRDDSLYSGAENRYYGMLVTAAAGVAPNRTATIKVGKWGNGATTEQVISLNEAVTTTLTASLGDDVTLVFAFGAVHFVVGDTFVFNAKAPRSYYSAKDDRNYDMTVTALPHSLVTFQWVTDTIAGGSGFTSIDDLTRGTLPDNIWVWARNSESYEVTELGSVPAAPPLTLPLLLTTAALPSLVSVYDQTAGALLVAAAASPPGPGEFFVDTTVSPWNIEFNAAQSTNEVLMTYHVQIYTVGDTWEWSTANSNVVNWSLHRQAVETIAAADVRNDPIGTITGVPGAYYVVLSYAPVNTPDYVQITSTHATVAFSWVTNMPYVYFAADPGAAITIRYTHKGLEPDPSQSYYMTALYLRPAADYDNPTLYLTVEELKAEVGPMDRNNDALIAAELIMENRAYGCYVCQVSDPSGEGVYTGPDYKRAIDATEQVADITDVCLVGYYAGIADVMNSVVFCNGDYQRKYRMGWFGAPTGMVIGDAGTPDTIVYTAKSTLQVYGDNPAHGCFVLVPHTWALRTVQMLDGTVQQLTLDGSFIAAAAAGRNSGFVRSRDTLLRQQLFGFDEIQTYTQPERLILGGASTLYIVDKGSGVYQFGESITVDDNGDDVHEISATCQQQFVSRYIVKKMDEALPGIVPDTEQQGVALITSYLVELLAGLVSSKDIAPYQNSSGGRRQIDPSADVQVVRDDIERTKYHYRYWYMLAYPIKRLMGVYSVDVNLFANS